MPQVESIQPTILLSQQGHERALQRAGIIRPHIIIDLFKFRKSKLGIINSISRTLFYVAWSNLRGRQPTVLVSSIEADEALAILWLFISFLRLRVGFWRLRTNNREKNFETLGRKDLPLPKRTLRVLAAVNAIKPRSVEYIRNDIGQPSYALRIPLSRDMLLQDLSQRNFSSRRPSRLLILLEPERSTAILDVDLWEQHVINICKSTREQFPQINIVLKAHPFQPCRRVPIVHCKELDPHLTIFDELSQDDWVIGTFGNVIDVAPLICRTSSLFFSVARQDCPREIFNRVESSGAELL